MAVFALLAATILASAGDADDRLLRIVLHLYSGEEGPKRAPYATELGGLGDPRAVGPLAQATLDRSLSVRTAAIKALAHYDTQEAREALLRAARESDDLSPLAVDSLAQQTPDGKVLLELAGDRGASDEIRRLALGRAREKFPDLVQSSPAPIDTSGRGIAITSGVLFGGYTLAAVGNLGNNQSGPAIGALGGALVGGGAAIILTQSGSITRGQGAAIATAGGWGLATGLAAGTLTDRNPSSTVVTSFGLLGELAGLVPALALRDRISLTGGDVFLANLTGLAGVSIASGALLYLAPRDDVRPGVAVTMVAGLSGLGAGMYFARDLHFTPGGQLAPAAGALMGGLLTSDVTLALSPFDDRRDRRNGGAWLLGIGLGAASGGALAQLAPDLTRGDELGILAGGALARAAAGGALRLASGSESSDHVASAAGLVAGGLASAMLLPRTRLDESRLVVGSLGAAWALWQGLGVAAYHDQIHPKSTISDTDRLAVARFSIGVGGLAGIALVPAAHVTVGQALAASSTGVWALWLSHWASVATNAPTSTTIRTDLVLSDAGLVAGALAVSPLFRVPPAAIGIASLYGVGGAALFSLGAALFTANQASGHPVAIANVLGTAFGLSAGVVAASTVHRGLLAGASAPDPGLRIAGLPLPQVLPLVARDGAGLSLVWQ